MRQEELQRVGDEALERQVIGTRTTLPAEAVAGAIRALQERGELEVDEVVLARWLGWAPQDVARVLSGTAYELGVVQIGQVCEALHCTPYALWGPELGRQILDVYGPQDWPAYIEPLFDAPSSVSPFVQRRVDQIADEVVRVEGPALGAPSSQVNDFALHGGAEPSAVSRVAPSSSVEPAASSMGERLVAEWSAVEADVGAVPTLDVMSRPDARRR